MGVSEDCIVSIGLFSSNDIIKHTGGMGGSRLAKITCTVVLCTRPLNESNNLEFPGVDRGTSSSLIYNYRFGSDYLGNYSS